MRNNNKGKENIIYIGLAYKDQKLICILNSKLIIKTNITLCQHAKSQWGFCAERCCKDIDSISM